MRTLVTPLLLVATVALLLAAQAPAAPRIGVVDLEAVFESHPGKSQMETDLMRVRDELEAKLLSLETEARRLANERDLYQAGTPKRAEIERNLQALAQDMDRERAVARDEFAQRKIEARRSLLADAMAAAAAYGEQMGYTAVFQKKMNLSNGLPTWDSVVYHQNAIDLTAAITAELKKSAPEPPK